MRVVLRKYLLFLFPLFTKEISIGLVVIMLLGLYQIFATNEPERVFSFERPDYMKGEKTNSVFLRMHENIDKEFELKLPLSEVESNEKDRLDYLDLVNKDLKNYILQQNNSFRIVEVPIMLPETYKKCKVVYSINPIHLIDKYGWYNIYVWKEQEQFSIDYSLYFEDERLEDSVVFVIKKTSFTKKYNEIYLKYLVEEAWKMNDLNKDENEVFLPREYEFYSTSRPMRGVQILGAFIVLILFCAVLSRTEQKIQNITYNQLKRIHLTYLINNFILFFQTGLTIQKCYVLSIQNRLDSVEEKQIFFEHLKKLEVLVERDNELNMSMEQFLLVFPYSEGRRFIRLITQNIKQGDHLLVQQLQQLSSSMWEHRIRLARKESEKASSKLIFPMLLIFIVILVITIVPTLIEVKNFL